MKKFFKDLQKAMLSGVSYMMPLVVAGGVMLAISLMTATTTDKGLVPNGEFMIALNTLGKAAFAMMIPVLSAYIANSIAGRPGLAPGFILGYIANNPVGDTGAKTGFLGAMLVAVAAGYLAKWIKTWKVGKTLRSIMPIIVIPTLVTFIVGVAYIFLIANPMSGLVDILIQFLANMNGSSKILLAICIGFMNAFDMGGPVTKTVSMFTLALMNEGIFEPNGMFRITVAIPPIGIFLSTLIAKNKYTEEERDAAKAAGIMGCLGITEGAIPFAVKDFKRVIPSTMVGAAVGAIIGAIGGVTCPVPHGGFIVLPVVGQPLWFIAGILGGSLVTAIMLSFLKPEIETVEAK